MFLLDTNICIELLRGRSHNLERRLLACQPDEVALSSIVVSELMYGVENSSNPQKNHQQLAHFLSGFQVFEFGIQEARAYGKIRAYLKGKGQLIGPADLFIAAHALANQLILVTNNEREFQRVPNLVIENWLKAE